jgi:hypothetical protein
MYYKYPVSRMAASDKKIGELENKSVFSEPLHWGLQQQQQQQRRR